MEPTTVVYIAGCGRSGSTLLDLLLGRLDGWFSMGEFRLFWHAVRDHWRCGCGHDVEDCPIWSAVLAEAEPPAVESVLADRRETIRIRRVPALVQPKLLGRHTAAHDRFAATLDATYRSAQRVSGARVLIDSSKDPMYGIVMSSLPGVRLHVVHLVRDSRAAVTWSWQRKQSRPEITEKQAFLPQHGALHTSLEWDLRHSLVHILKRQAAGYTRVTYESLVTDPVATLSSITRALAGVDAPTLSTTDPCELGNHTVAGNPMRFSPTGVELRPDLEWQDALDPGARRLVTVITYPLLRVYGYV